MRTLWRLLLCLICLAPSVTAQTWRVDPTRLNAWAQDSTGRAWGIGVLMGPDLYRWEGSAWIAAAVAGITANYRPAALAAGSDGQVYCLWSSGDEEHTVTRLADGKHVFEAAALDERLQIDPTRATAEVTVHVDAQKQLATLIEQLNDPDYSVRNAAVAALVHQPKLALPLLQSAREKAGPDQRWWIDAAIQQIHQSLANPDFSPPLGGKGRAGL